MSLAQQRLRSWAYGLADQTISTVRYGLLDSDLRARALKTTLDDLRPGLGEQVRQRTVVYARGGHTHKSALREALAEAFMKIGAAKLNAYGEGMGNIDDLLDQAASTGSTLPPSSPPSYSPPARQGKSASTTSGDWSLQGDDPKDKSSNGSGILDSVGNAVGGVLTGVMGIFGAVEDTRQARRELSAGQERYLVDASYTDLERERQFLLRQQALDIEGEANLATAEREARQEALDRELSAREAELRLSTPPPPRGDDDETDIGTYVVLGGILVAVMVGGYAIYKVASDDEEKS